MATEEQISRVFQAIGKAHPENFGRHFDEMRAGLGAVMRLLYTERKPLTAGAISERLEISTARVAVLLKKLEAKGTIRRQKDPADARKTLVELTEDGVKSIQATWRQIREKIGKVIDAVGEERLLIYLEVGKEIHEIIASCPEDFEEAETRKEEGADD